MKTIALILLIFVSCSTGRAELIRLVATNGEPSRVITVNTNEVAKILQYYANEYAHFFYSMDGIVVTNEASLGLPKLTIIQGPATIQMRTFNISSPSSQNDLAVAVIELTRGISEVQMSNTVVIPEDSSGPVQIILESSADLVTWTGATPGTYGTSTQKRFFRLRAVR
jgi:hypothetical protein